MRAMHQPARFLNSYLLRHIHERPPFVEYSNLLGSLELMRSSSFPKSIIIGIVFLIYN